MKTTVLQVQGMTCGHCVSAVQKALQAQPGVISARVDLQGGSAEVQHDEASVAAEQLISAVEQEGYKARV